MTFKLQPRPGSRSPCATPGDEVMLSIFGGPTFEGVAFTRDQICALERLYGFDLAGGAAEAAAREQAAYEAELAEYEEKRRTLSRWEADRLRPPKPPEPEKLAYFQRGGDTLQLFRHAQRDALRMVALVAKFVEAGRDPVRLLARLLMDAGYDVPVDPDWANDEEVSNG